MYRLRQMDVDDKVCKQVDIALLKEVYPKAVIERYVQESQGGASKTPTDSAEYRIVASWSGS